MRWGLPVLSPEGTRAVGGGSGRRQPGPLARARRSGQRARGACSTTSTTTPGCASPASRGRDRLRLGGRPDALVPLGSHRLHPPLHGRCRGGDRGPEGHHLRRVGGPGGRCSPRGATRSTSRRASRTRGSATSTAWPPRAGSATRLTTRPGAHLVEVSPDEATFADLFSDAANPPEIQLVPARGTGPGAAGHDLHPSGVSELRVDRGLRSSRFEARDGVKVPARLYTPQSLAASPDPRRPAVIFIHGAGYLQNAHRYWSQLLPRVHVPPPAGLARLRRAGRRLPRQRGLRPRLAHRRRRPHGRQGPRRHRGRGRLPGGRARSRRRSGSASTAAATAAS